MKKAMNFRLSHQAITLLSYLEKTMHTSKTAIIEQALVFLAQTKNGESNPFLKLIGTIPDDEADQMLDAIKKSRRNKKTTVILEPLQNLLGQDRKH